MVFSEATLDSFGNVCRPGSILSTNHQLEPALVPIFDPVGVFDAVDPGLLPGRDVWAVLRPIINRNQRWFRFKLLVKVLIDLSILKTP